MLCQKDGTNTEKQRYKTKEFVTKMTVAENSVDCKPHQTEHSLKPLVQDMKCAIFRK